MAKLGEVGTWASSCPDLSASSGDAIMPLSTLNGSWPYRDTQELKDGLEWWHGLVK